jgi:hypothetical protein
VEADTYQQPAALNKWDLGGLNTSNLGNNFPNFQSTRDCPGIQPSHKCKKVGSGNVLDVQIALFIVRHFAEICTPEK